MTEESLRNEKEWWNSNLDSIIKADISTVVGRKSKYIFVGFANQFEVDSTYSERVEWVNPVESSTHPFKYFLHNMLNFYTFGRNIHWGNYYEAQNLHKVRLPTYPFPRRIISADFSEREAA